MVVLEQENERSQLGGGRPRSVLGCCHSFGKTAAAGSQAPGRGEEENEFLGFRTYDSTLYIMGRVIGPRKALGWV